MKKHSICHKTPYLRPLWRAAALMLALLLGLTALPYRAAAEASGQISVGLYFVRNALESANLQNVTGYGSGYQLGIYEADASGDRKQFRALAETGCTEISMLVDRTMYLSGNSYASTPSGGWQTTVGAYHLELVYAYGDYAAAQQAASNYPGGFVAYSYGQYYARFGSYATYGEALADAGAYSDCAVTGESEYGITVVNTLTGAILFELDQGAGTTLGVVPLGGTETRTWFKGYQYNGGFRYDRPEGGAMHVANIVPLEQYVAAVLSREFVPSWPDEALKAAACCIRTFAATGGQHSTFDVCNDTCCQVYRGVSSGRPVGASAGALPSNGGTADLLQRRTHSGDLSQLQRRRDGLQRRDLGRGLPLPPERLRPLREHRGDRHKELEPQLLAGGADGAGAPVGRGLRLHHAGLRLVLFGARTGHGADLRGQQRPDLHLHRG